tara:strand:- start:2409 stop:2591 length:183 start_codon:yes stop_codon:yes gene_type:complete
MPNFKKDRSKFKMKGFKGFKNSKKSSPYKGIVGDIEQDTIQEFEETAGKRGKDFKTFQDY